MSETVTMTLTEFLLARLAEDEAAAHEADSYLARSWMIGDSDEVWACTGGVVAQVSYGTLVEHIARHDPARVLADVEGRRALVEGVLEFQRSPLWQRPAWFPEDSKWHGDAPYVLRCIAAAYASHPDFDESWRA